MDRHFFYYKCRGTAHEFRLYVRKEGENIQEDTLVSRILEGDEAAFRELVHTYRSYLFQVIYAIVQHPKDAEDITQEVLVRIHFSLPQYQHKGLKTWMARIATNKAIDFKRNARRQMEQPTAELHDMMAAADHPDYDTEMTAIRNETRELVQSRLERIPANYQDVLIAYYLENKTYLQISEEQGITVKTVESKLYRAKQWTRKHWKEEDFE